MPEDFTERVIAIIRRIPEGKVMTYGSIAQMAGDSRHARQVSRILHSMSKKYQLPWHRVINSRGYISLPKYAGYDEQKARLEMEGIRFGLNDKVDLEKYLWKTIH